MLPLRIVVILLVAFACTEGIIWRRNRKTQSKVSSLEGRVNALQNSVKSLERKYTRDLKNLRQFCQGIQSNVQKQTTVLKKTKNSLLTRIQNVQTTLLAKVEATQKGHKRIKQELRRVQNECQQQCKQDQSQDQGQQQYQQKQGQQLSWTE